MNLRDVSIVGILAFSFVWFCMTVQSCEIQIRKMRNECLMSCSKDVNCMVQCKFNG